MCFTLDCQSDSVFLRQQSNNTKGIPWIIYQAIGTTIIRHVIFAALLGTQASTVASANNTRTITHTATLAHVATVRTQRNTITVGLSPAIVDSAQRPLAIWQSLRRRSGRWKVSKENEKLLDEYERFMHWMKNNTEAGHVAIQTEIDKTTAVIDYIIRTEGGKDE
jgi:hypothetical protein